MNDRSDDSAPDGGPFDVDRRRDRRVDLGTTVMIRSRNAGDGSGNGGGLSESAEFTVEGEGEDISVGGMYLIAEERLSAGSTVDVEFEIPEIDETFDLVAQVRWTRRRGAPGESSEWGIGLQFDEIEEDRREALDEFVLQSLLD